MEYNYYLVKIVIGCGGYDKESIHCIEANTAEEAKHIAIHNEAHNPLINLGDGRYVEEDDYFSYFAKEPTKLTKEEAEVFIKFHI